MKYLIVLFFVLTACNANDEPEEVAEVEVPTVLNPEEMYAWSVEADSMQVIRNTDLPENYLNADSLIRGLNSQYPEIQLQKVRQSNDTLYTRIPNAEFLTQRMGSSGPEMYFATLYFNLTAVPGVRYVNVDLEEGDHAGPGVYGPDDFKDYKVDSTGNHY